MKKAILFVAFGLVSCVSFVGCSEKQEGSIAVPEEMDKYETPEDYDPSSDTSS